MSEILFKMTKIKVEQFAILTDIDYENHKNISLKTIMNVSFASEIHSISVDIRFVFHCDDVQIIVLEVRCNFEVDEEGWKKFNANGEFDIPDDFLGHLALHTVGTARGILFCKTEGTKYASLILPPINVMHLLKNKPKQA